MPAVNQILNEPLIYLSGPGPGASGNTDMRVNGCSSLVAARPCP